MTDSSASHAVFCRVRGAMGKEKGRLKNLSSPRRPEHRCAAAQHGP